MSRTTFLRLFSKLWYPGTGSLCGTTRACLTLTLLLSGAIGSMRGQVPGCVAYTANYPCVYVVNSGPDTVSVINSTTNTVIVPAVAVGGTPMGAAITPDNRSVYVVNNDDGTVSIVDTTTNTVPTQAVLLVSNGVGLGSPTQVAITPDGTAAYVVGIGLSGFVAIIDTATQKLTLAITTGLSSPVAIAFSPDGKFAYITDSCSGEPATTACVDVLDTSTHLINQAPGTPILIPGSVSNFGESIAVTADGGLISVPVDDLNNNLGIAFISVAYNTITNTYSYKYVTTLSLNVTSTTSDYGIAITPSGILYAAEPALDSVAVVNTNTQTLSNTIQVGSSPTGVAATPDGAQVYVSNGFAGSVSVIDTQTQKVTTTLPVQTSPAGVAVMPTIVPTIQTPPASQTVSSGQTATLSVQASGAPRLSYQWYQVAGITLTPIQGATSFSFTTPALTSTTTYLVSVSNVAASIKSKNATITVLPPPSADLFLRIRPSATTVHKGDLLTFAFPVWNLGPDVAEGEVLSSLQVPAGTTFDYLRISGTPGLGTCTHPPYGGTGQIICHEGNGMAPNTTWTVRLTVKVTAHSGNVITESAATMSDTPDPNLANNTATVSLKVQ